MLIFLVGAAAILPANKAHAQTPKDPIQTAFDLCTNFPDKIDDARVILSNAQWEDSEKATFTTLYWLTAAVRFDANDLEKTFGNAAFMAASVLGNSALGKDQIGVEFEDYALAVLGLPEQTPYCVMTGPKDLAPDFFQALGEPKPQMSQSSASLVQIQGTLLGNYGVSIGIFDLEELTDLIRQSPLADDYKGELQSVLTPSVIQIANLEYIQ